MMKLSVSIPGYIACALVVSALAIASSAQSNPLSYPDTSPLLSCSPAPCVFQPTLVTQGRPLWSNLIAVNPTNPAQLVVGTADSDCQSQVSVSHSEDGGTVWAPSPDNS